MSVIPPVDQSLLPNASVSIINTVCDYTDGKIVNHDGELVFVGVNEQIRNLSDQDHIQNGIEDQIGIEDDSSDLVFNFGFVSRL